MKRRTPAFALLLVLPAALLSACAVPLGPGYTVKKQQLEAHWTGTPELAVRGSYRLQNTGKGPLDYIEVTLPPEPRRSGLQVTLDKSPIATQPADELAPAGTVRIPISPALPPKKKRDLVIEYRLAGAVRDVSATPSFYLETRGWYPALREREGLFGSGGAPPEKWDLRVTVPRDFLVHASGQPKGRKRRGEAVEHRFRQRRGEDFDPFVVAGRYHEEKRSSNGVTVVLWSGEPLKPDRVERAAEGVGSTTRLYERMFGSRSEKELPVHVVFVAGKPDSQEQRMRQLRSLPSVALYPIPSAADDFDSSMGLIQWSLSYTWFGHLVYPAPEQEFLLSDAIAMYAVAKATPLRGGETREEIIQGLLRQHDDSPVAREQNLPASLADASLTKDAFAAATCKGALFYLALEDRFGEAALHKAFSRVTYGLRGRAVTTNDLRVAIHLETGEDPAEFFRQWLNQPGIPEEFRKKYEKHAAENRQ